MRQYVIRLIEDLSVVLTIYDCSQHINTQIVIFEHKSPVLHLGYCIVTDKQRVKRMFMFRRVYMLIGYVGFGILVVRLQKGPKSDIALVLTW